ncbi:MAG: NifB/NifX family molybdenum-iron cluster-binding protein [Anaerolineae bacterium]|jgi:predicted Fe-Mo cluster-binding NifX family protein|nr:NifB/NifX family molybdenum-iron cluster-binding protein [Anaerolineae bacterium]MBT4309247.1 NifB/NifX family molybdenum-iron cluster-binding protein [Anaerolineae bacterium]MBT4458522.1 NifB/NifX family molybdenum-iron cluster-binding protein [Anaerolineae bacterium]MBT4842698.1 NifB/NifX family molybdenum-iron cluster-binding protein [Anaerolineae bacterium]MBT6062059.1 NifB/NifX family molybdenum-iron cluster-binding protein [Anaerolineae bacterium]
MKIAISSHDGKKDTEFSTRFGRCDFFVFIDSETSLWETKPNPAKSASGGAGPQTVQFLAENGVEATITGRYGPKAYTTLEAAGIRTFVAKEGTPEELLEKFLAEELEEVDSATGKEMHH